MQVATANLADAKKISMFAAVVADLSEPDNNRRVKKWFCNSTRGSCSQLPPTPNPQPPTPPPPHQQEASRLQWSRVPPVTFQVFPFPFSNFFNGLSRRSSWCTRLNIPHTLRTSEKLLVALLFSKSRCLKTLKTPHFVAKYDPTTSLAWQDNNIPLLSLDAFFFFFLSGCGSLVSALQSGTRGLVQSEGSRIPKASISK